MDARPSSGEVSDEGTHEPAIPDDVATGREELPPDFWDAPPAGPPASRGSEPGPPPAREAARRPPSSRPRQAQDRAPAPDHVPGQRDRHAAPDGDLERALLGGDATADELPDALRDTVDALRELFPGELLAVAPRADDDEGARETGADDAGSLDDHGGEDDAEDGSGDTTHERTDAG